MGTPNLPIHCSTTTTMPGPQLRVSPDAANDKVEIRFLFGWQDAVRQGNR
ncbi:MAG: hypothetical protein LAP85_01140 [Acidobacteriia bacterium]|nr:hypothetical protein [Terriglobia bacterium]